MAAVSAGGKLYDPYYRADLLSRGSDDASGRRGRAWYDDFSVSEHLHVHKPLSMSLDSTGQQQAVKIRGMCPSVLKIFECRGEQASTVVEACRGVEEGPERQIVLAPEGEGQPCVGSSPTDKGG